MTIIELNNCTLFSLSLSIWFSFEFFLTFHEILSLSHKTTHSAHNYHNFPSDQILELTLVRLCAANLQYVRFLFVFTLKELAVLFYYTFFAPLLSLNKPRSVASIWVLFCCCNFFFFKLFVKTAAAVCYFFCFFLLYWWWLWLDFNYTRNLLALPFRGLRRLTMFVVVVWFCLWLIRGFEIFAFVLFKFPTVLYLLFSLRLDWMWILWRKRTRLITRFTFDPQKNLHPMKTLF